ncbi:SDR family NAD(P)-dependent oxidoreductase [Rhodosalinus sp.]|uniref:SDR family NAD(P)-dependent oxidoreductase n=1 Tax=Rhodosalinus sp. TaxID=2047741 RepID=UPI003564C2C3
MTDDRPLALVTGASRGLGAALAEALAATHHVLAVARTQGGLEELDDRIRAAGGQATLAPMDLTQPEAVAGLARGIFDRWGRLDLWAHTAIQAPPLSPAPSIDDKGFARALAVNVTATQALIAALAPLLGTAGRAVFFDDPRAGEAFFGGYGATKAAQAALARSWRAETVRTGPRVHLLTPAPMPTALRARFFPGEDRDALADRHAEARRLLAEAG